MRTLFKIIFTLVIIWLLIGLFDFMLVINDHAPIFCIKTNDTYQGLGYSCSVYAHPITDHTEHYFSIFGKIVNSTVTNEL